MPVEASLLAPLAPLADLAAHKEKLLAGMRPHVCVERPEACELLLRRPEHLVQHRAFHVDDFVVREGEYEVLAPRVCQAEGDVGVEVAAGGKGAVHGTEV